MKQRLKFYEFEAKTTRLVGTTRIDRNRKPATGNNQLAVYDTKRNQEDHFIRHILLVV